MKSLSRTKLRLLGIATGAGYGLFARLVFGGHMDTSDVFAVMTSAFILGVPIALGFVTIWLGESGEKPGWRVCLLRPWEAALVCLAACLALAWEGLICVMLWVPLVLILSSFGGLLAGLAWRVFRADRSRTLCLAVVALAPFAAAPLENLRVAATEIRHVDTHIDIHAGPHTVWQQIKTVPRITEREQRGEFIHWIGFPRPLEARLEGEGIGAVRYATFERDVLFIETITEWVPDQRLAFSIHADAKNIPPTTFDEHVTIGGPYFDVLDGSYRIEALGNGVVRLHLSSRQRLSTGFNFYSHLWTEYLMARLQNYILEVIKTRCEAA
ncbi:MAG: hypothetical protein RIQ79_1327 [Verrucomicrobiota bacterium]